jgi:general secretion pathway protein D
LTLKFTPQVFPNQDVQVKMSIESKDVLGASTLTPTFTERTITGTARVQNNRTMMLASVATDVTSQGRQGLPILGLLPIVGRLFSSPTNDNRRIDIVIAVTPRVLRAPAVTPRDEEMRPSGTLQSPTTGSLEAMLREADREDQLAELSRQKREAAAKKAAHPTVFEIVPVNNGATAANNTAVPANTGAPTATGTNQPAAAQTSTANQTTAEVKPQEELPAFVPAPKSLVSSTSATEVAAVNTNVPSEAAAKLTSLSAKPIEAALTPITTRGRTAQVNLTPGEQSMRVGETRRFALDLRADVPLALAIIALRFDSKVVKVRAVAPDGTNASGVSFTQSNDASGVCLISISNLGALKGLGTLLFIDVEGIGAGDAGLLLDKASTHLVATDALDLAVDLTPIRATVKQ